jgi:molybdate transport system regulatory protein
MRRTGIPTPRERLVGRLSLDTAAGALASERRIRLLEAITEHGSITRAARALPLSYKAAWDALDAMNNLAPSPLVERTAGGRQGGGTRLTDAGHELVAMYRALEREQQRALDSLAPQRARQRSSAAGGVEQLQALLRRMAVRTSARNQFAGSVVQLRQSKVSVEVTVALDAQTQIVAGVTRESAQALRLAVGSPLLALVKASSVLLAQGDLQTSARNHLSGTVSRIVAGPIGAEVTLALAAGRSVTAGITRESLERLALARGQTASALFKASSVILVALD